MVAEAGTPPRKSRPSNGSRAQNRQQKTEQKHQRRTKKGCDVCPGVNLKEPCEDSYHDLLRGPCLSTFQADLSLYTFAQVFLHLLTETWTFKSSLGKGLLHIDDRLF